MPLTGITAKANVGPNAVGYGSWMALDFDSATLSSSQTTGTVAAVQPLAFAIKVLGLAVVMTTVNGTAPVAVNICSGVGPQGGVGPIDPSIYPPATNQMAQNGNILFATDQQLNVASAPVANTIYTLYPVNDLWDIIWPGGSLISLRISSGASAANGILKAIAYCVPVDIHPYLPNALNPFAPTLATL